MNPVDTFFGRQKMLREWGKLAALISLKRRGRGNEGEKKRWHDFNTFFPTAWLL